MNNSAPGDGGSGNLNDNGSSHGLHRSATSPNPASSVSPAAVSAATVTAASALAVPAATSGGSSFRVIHTGTGNVSLQTPQPSPQIAPRPTPGAALEPHNLNSGTSRHSTPVHGVAASPSGASGSGGSARSRGSGSGRDGHRSRSRPTPTGTPPLAPRTNPVPLITPRYQRKSRTNKRMEITDQFADALTPTQALLQQTTETLTIHNGRQTYTQEMHFHTYDVYRHGARQIVSRSVGYSSDGDVVVHREDHSEPSDVENNTFVRRRTEITGATVLDRAARRPLTDTEAARVARGRKLNLNRSRYKKYPGIHAPRNKKLRNQLLNDYLLHAETRDTLDKARLRREKEYRRSNRQRRRNGAHVDPDGNSLDDSSSSSDSSEEEEAGTVFSHMAPHLHRALDMSDERQQREFERLGLGRFGGGGGGGGADGMNSRPPPDPDAPETRFGNLNLRLRGELQHALTSEFMTREIEDLDAEFTQFVAGGPTDDALVYRFRDGYCRLVCHGVAGYYCLVSESRTGPDGVKYMYVQVPKARRTGEAPLTLPKAPLIHLLCKNRSNFPRHANSPDTTPVMRPSPSPGNSPVPAAKGAPDIQEAEEAGLPPSTLAQPMSPLSLGETTMPSVDPHAAQAPSQFTCPPPMSTTTCKGGNSADGARAEAQGASQIPSVFNPFVRRSAPGRFPPPNSLEVYEPCLMVNREAYESLRQGVEVDDDGCGGAGESAYLDNNHYYHADGAGGVSMDALERFALGMKDPSITVPLNATQKKKVKRAMKAAAAACAAAAAAAAEATLAGAGEGDRTLSSAATGKKHKKKA